MRSKSLAFMVAVFVLGSSASVTPEPRRGDVAAGYSLLRLDGYTFALGASVSVAAHFGHGLSAVLEVAGNGEWGESGLPQNRVVKFETSMGSLLAGPRLALRAGAVRPYGEVLVGFVRSADRIRVDALNLDMGGSLTQFSVRPGVGLDLVVARRWGLRFGAGVGLTSQSEPRSGERVYRRQYRFTAGVVYYLGRP